MVPAYLKGLAFNVQFGLNPEMKEIFVAGNSILNRMDFKRLEDFGIMSLSDIATNPNSVTGQYLTGVREIAVPKVRRKGNGKSLSV